MAVYKVPQDVEADDKLIGPFSFRQFVFILIMVGNLYLTWVFFRAFPPLAVPPLLVAGLFGILGLWPRKDQPVEVYLAALIKFWTQPRKKIWNQEGHVEHVIITAPKKVAHQYTDGLNVGEVRSRLHNLASTLDSRGWAAKNAVADTVAYADQSAMMGQNSDRLVMPQITATSSNQAVTTTAEEDVLDTDNNPIGQNFEEMVHKAEESRKEALRQQMQSVASGAVAAAAEPHVDYNPYPEMQQNTIQPLGSKPKQKQVQQIEEPPKQPSEQAPSDAILNLANNSDLNVSTIARQAEKAENALQSGDTIELH